MAIPPQGNGEFFTLTAAEMSAFMAMGGTLTSLQDQINHRIAYAGTYTLPTLTPSGGSLVVGEGEYVFANGDNGAPPFTHHTLAGGSFPLTQNATNFIIADWNDGAPLLRHATTNVDVDGLQIFPVCIATYDGANIAFVDLNQAARGLANKMELRFARTRRIEAEPGGVVIGESGTRNVTVTAGRVWFAATYATLAAFTSATHEMEFYYHVAGVWTSATVTQYNNTQYDNGTALATLTNNRYAVNWVYRTVGQNVTKCFMVMGTGDYTLGQAQVASAPTGLPAELAAASLLVGRIIVQKSASSATQIDSAFATMFTAAGVTDHNGLSSLQGGTAAEYYHLTAAQHAIFTGTPVYADLTAANAALPANRIFQNTALGYLDITTA